MQSIDSKELDYKQSNKNPRKTIKSKNKSYFDPSIENKMDQHSAPFSNIYSINQFKRNSNSNELNLERRHVNKSLKEKTILTLEDRSTIKSGKFSKNIITGSFNKIDLLSRNLNKKTTNSNNINSPISSLSTHESYISSQTDKINEDFISNQIQSIYNNAFNYSDYKETNYNNFEENEFNNIQFNNDQNSNEVIEDEYDYKDYDYKEINDLNELNELKYNNTLNEAYVDISTYSNENDPDVLKEKLRKSLELCKKYEEIAYESLQSLNASFEVKNKNIEYENVEIQTIENVPEQYSNSIKNSKKNNIMELMQNQLRVFTEKELVSVQDKLNYQNSIAIQSSVNSINISTETGKDFFNYQIISNYKLDKEVNTTSPNDKMVNNLNTQYNSIETQTANILDDKLEIELLKEELNEKDLLIQQLIMYQNELEVKIKNQKILPTATVVIPNTMVEINTVSIYCQTEEDYLLVEDNKLKQSNNDLQFKLNESLEELNILKTKSKNQEEEYNKMSSALSMMILDQRDLKEKLEILNQEIKEKDIQIQDLLKQDILEILENSNGSYTTSEEIQNSIIDCCNSVKKCMDIISEHSNLVPKFLPVNEDIENALKSLTQIIQESNKYSELLNNNKGDSPKYKMLLPIIIPKRPTIPTINVYWNKIEGENLLKSLWIRKGLSIDSSNITFDFLEFENFFEKENIVRIVDERKFLNFNHLSSSLNIELSDLFKAIKSVDEKICTDGILFKLAAFLPSEKEESHFKLIADYNSLSKVDLFIYNLFTIPRIRERLKVWRITVSFSKKYSSLIEELDMYSDAINSLLTSQRFQQILKILLAAGNFLNGNNPSLFAYGFSLLSLNQFNQIQNQNKNGTLLHYITKFIKRKFTSIVDFDKDLKSFLNIEKLSVSNLNEEYNDLISSINDVKEESKILSELSVQDSFTTKIFNFLKNSQEKMKQLEEKYHNVIELLNLVATTFGENESTFIRNADDFMQSIITFLEIYKIERLR